MTLRLHPDDWVNHAFAFACRVLIRRRYACHFTLPGATVAFMTATQQHGR